MYRALGTNAVTHYTKTMSDSIQNCSDLGDALEQTIPTNNLARDALGELIGSTVKYHTGADYEIEDLTLTFPGHAAGKESVTDIVRALGVPDMNAVRNVTFPDDETPNAYDQDTTETVTVTFH